MRSSPAAAGPYLLALDVGSSSARAILFDMTGESRGVHPAARHRYRWLQEPEGAMECDADDLLTGVAAVIDAALEEARAEGLEIRGVATTTFWHSLLGLGPDGVPVTPVYAWGDTRAADVALALREEVEGGTLHSRTGCHLHPSYPVVKLAWLRGRDPGAFARAASWISFPEYLEERFFGLRRCSFSMASGSGLLDVHRLEWDPEALEIAGIRAEMLSPLVDAADALRGLRPDFARRWPELAEVPWFPALGDGACANAGSGAVGPDLPGLTVGTSAAVRTLWEPAGTVKIPADLWAYRLDRRRWVAGGALSNGGNAVAWLRRSLRLPENEEVEALLREMPPAGHGLTVLPFLHGERGPGWRRETTSMIAGMTGSTRPEELLQGWMEAVAYRIARVASRLEEVVGPAREVLASGGALHASSAWTQILADALARPVRLPLESEATGRGAALVALENLGAIPDIRAVARTEGVRYEPRADAHERHRHAMKLQQALLETQQSWLEHQHPPHDEIPTH